MDKVSTIKLLAQDITILRVSAETSPSYVRIEPNVPTLMAKSTAYMASTARMMVKVRPSSSSGKKKPTISFVKPSVRRLKATMMEPKTINGRRLPHLDLDWSAMTPMTG